MITNPLVQRAKALWPNHPSYQAAWLRSVALLGDKWLLAKHIGRTA